MTTTSLPPRAKVNHLMSTFSLTIAYWFVVLSSASVFQPAHSMRFPTPGESHVKAQWPSSRVVSSAALMFTLLLLLLSGRSHPKPCLPPAPSASGFTGSGFGSGSPVFCMSMLLRYQSLMTFTKNVYSNRFQEQKQGRPSGCCPAFEGWIRPAEPLGSEAGAWWLISEDTFCVTKLGGTDKVWGKSSETINLLPC